MEMTLLINGEERTCAGSFEVHDPAREGEIVGQAAAASAADAEDAVGAAQAAWPAWAALSATERAQLALKALDGLDADTGEIAEILSRENGKVRFEAELDLQGFLGRFHQAAAFAPALDEPGRIDGPPFATTIEHVPAGVVTIIVPFNWPLAILAASLPYALMAGNTVVVKPPPTTPLSMVRTLRQVALALPPGVLNVVTGADEVVGPVVVGDPRVKHVCFTGSVGAGRRIMAMATPNLTRVTLELGGNDPAIVLGDAVLDEAALGRLASATFMTTGQVCMAVKRLYVPRRRFDEVVSGLRTVLAGTRVGCGLDPGVTMGPLHTRRQRDFVVELRDEARNAGAEVTEFGEYAGTDGHDGHYLLPALVLDPPRDTRIVTEEQFGPVLPVLPYDDEAEAVAQANDTWSGLCSSVWSGDTEHAMAVAKQLRTGVTFFNNHSATAVDERAPFGGFNQSGLGRELGMEGLLEFTETHVLSVPS
ncbi:aldehyde dehydrogenase family protein [Amycolatopsis sp. GM8]|uniref:aldehyde dehydrogenase family protein n=1 Tax=Amycolatopsis sp. GM8 TaxID=2896530 RepID=UPI001F20B036|nr:aldehyde dehydrogenase family protein [Amycolatopsis sp. GM8]